MWFCESCAHMYVLDPHITLRTKSCIQINGLNTLSMDVEKCQGFVAQIWSEINFIKREDLFLYNTPLRSTHRLQAVKYLTEVIPNK